LPLRFFPSGTTCLFGIFAGRVDDHIPTVSKSPVLAIGGNSALWALDLGVSKRRRPQCERQGQQHISTDDFFDNSGPSLRALLATYDWKSKGEVASGGKMSENESYTYAKAGVSIETGNALMRAIAPLAKATRRAGANADSGWIWRLFRPEGCGFQRSAAGRGQ
jgi:hypothetical protein